MRSLRSRLCLHRYRRWAGGLHHHAGRRHRGRLRLDRGSKIPAAVLAARGAVAAADPRDHAVAAALVEVAADFAAVPSQGRTWPADRPRTKMYPTTFSWRGAAGITILPLVMQTGFVALYVANVM